MKPLFILCLFTAVCAGTVYAQYDHEEPPRRIVDYGDIDSDGIADSLWYDNDREMIMFALSSRGFEPFGADSGYFENDGPDHTDLSAAEGGFTIIMGHMRSWGYMSYLYESESGRFRLWADVHENYGNAANDGSGTMLLDLLEEEFTGDWNYYDYEIDSLISLPTITVHVSNTPVYLDDEILDYAYPGYYLFDYYRNAYMWRPDLFPDDAESIRVVMEPGPAEDNYLYYISDPRTGEMVLLNDIEPPEDPDEEEEEYIDEK